MRPPTASASSLVLLGLCLVTPPARAAEARTWKEWDEVPAAARALSNPACRVALVIGNARYRSATDVDNAERDARAVAALLAGPLGFEVITDVNLGAQAQRALVETFLDRVQPGCVALVYYAGHAVQGIGGVNYLLPVDATLSDNPRLTAVSLQGVLDDLEARDVVVRLGFLDACRALVYDGERGARSTELAPVRGTGLFMGYAASPGQLADDGPRGDHSPFTRAFLAWAARPGLKVEQVFDGIQTAVAPTGQVPHGSDFLSGDFYFLPPLETVPSPPPPTPPRPVVPQRVETVAVAGRSYTIRASYTQPFTVEVQAFLAGRYEVSQALWTDVMGENPSWQSIDGRTTVAPDHPVQMVTWIDAAAFCNRLSALDGLEPYYEIQGDVVWPRATTGWRLPTLDEWWVLASAAGAVEVESAFEYDVPPRVPVTQGEPNALGVVHATGNVEEWLDEPGAHKPVGGGVRWFFPSALAEDSQGGKRPYDVPSPWRGVRVVRSAP